MSCSPICKLVPEQVLEHPSIHAIDLLKFVAHGSNAVCNHGSGHDFNIQFFSCQVVVNSVKLQNTFDTLTVASMSASDS